MKTNLDYATIMRPTPVIVTVSLLPLLLILHRQLGLLPGAVLTTLKDCLDSDDEPMHAEIKINEPSVGEQPDDWHSDYSIADDSESD